MTQSVGMVYLLENHPELFLHAYQMHCNLTVMETVNKNIRKQIIEDERAAKVQQLQFYYLRLSHILAERLEWVKKIDPCSAFSKLPFGVTCA